MCRPGIVYHRPMEIATPLSRAVLLEAVLRHIADGPFPIVSSPGDDPEIRDPDPQGRDELRAAKPAGPVVTPPPPAGALDGAKRRVSVNQAMRVKRPVSVLLDHPQPAAAPEERPKELDDHALGALAVEHLALPGERQEEPPRLRREPGNGRQAKPRRCRAIPLPLPKAGSTARRIHRRPRRVPR